jgi:hypothetical protein
VNQSLILGALMTLFAGMFWRKLDGIDKRMEKIEERLEKLSEKLSNLVGDFREFKGRTEALLSAEKKHTEPEMKEVSK